MLAPGIARAATVTVPGNAALLWTDPAKDATGTLGLPLFAAANQPTKDILRGAVCDTQTELHFFLTMSTLGASPDAARGSALQSEWEVRFDLAGVQYYIAAMVSPTGVVTFLDGSLGTGYEVPQPTSPAGLATPHGAFGSYANGVVELVLTTVDLGVGPRATITNVRGVTVDAPLGGGGLTPASAFVDQTASASYTMGSAPCSTNPAVGTTSPDTYYVSTSGSDSANGKTLATAFRTINRCAQLSAPGVTCLIRGGTYPETIRPAASGTAANPMKFAAYNDEKVVVSGADRIATAWRKVQPADVPVDLSLVPGYVAAVAGGHIYTTSVSPNDALMAQQLFVDGTMVNEARWPKANSNPLSGEFAFGGQGSNPFVLTSQDTAHTLDFPPGFWVGGQIHVCGGACWMLWDGTVVADAAGQYTFSSPVNSPGGAQICVQLCVTQSSPFFLSGKLGALSAPGEWFIDKTTGTLSMYAPDGLSPATHTVEIKKRAVAIDLSSRAGILIDGLSIFGATVATDDSTQDITLDGLDAKYLSHFSTIPAEDIVYDNYNQASRVIDTGIVLKGARNTLRNSVLTYSAGTLVSVLGQDNTVINNVLSESAYGGSFGGAINLSGSGAQIIRNTIYDTGAMGITVYNFTKKPAIPGGTTSETYYDNRIAYNDISNTHTRAQDGGGIYVCCTQRLGLTIDHNRIHDLMAKNARGTSGFGSPGLYLDLQADGVSMHHNEVWNVGSTALELNGHSNYLYSRDNAIYNNTFAGGQAKSYATFLVLDANGTKFTNNIFRGSIETTAGAAYANNLTSGTDPKFVDPLGDFHLKAGSLGLDKGKVIPGITDGYSGALPDIGAREAGDTWTAGCSMVVCKRTTVDDPGFTYSGAWTHCAASCDGTGADVYDYAGTLSSASTAGATATLPFTGTGVILHIRKGSAQGQLAVSIDGGPETVIETFQPGMAGDQLGWGARGLTSGAHTLKVRVLGTFQTYSGAPLVAIDRAEIIG